MRSRIVVLFQIFHHFPPPRPTDLGLFLATTTSPSPLAAPKGEKAGARGSGKYLPTNINIEQQHVWKQTAYHYYCHLHVYAGPIVWHGKDVESRSQRIFSNHFPSLLHAVGLASPFSSPPLPARSSVLALTLSSSSSSIITEFRWKYLRFGNYLSPFRLVGGMACISILSSLATRQSSFGGLLLFATLSPLSLIEGERVCASNVRI